MIRRVGVLGDMHGELQRVWAEGRFRFIVGGHTHRAMVRTFGSLTVINAGTLYREHDPCVALLDFEAGEYRHFAFEGHRIIGA